MMKMSLQAGAVAVAVGLFLGAAPEAGAQATPVGWTTTANVSGVFAGGNSAGTSFGFKARSERNWLRTQYFLEGGGLRQDATDISRYAVGAPGAFTVTEIETKSTKAENYFAETGFVRRMTERLYWEVGGGFKRDLFSGVEELWSGRAGVGYFWTNRSNQELKVGVGATYNHQKEQVNDPATKDNFAGGRFTVDYIAKFGTAKQSQFASKLAIDENLEVSEDLRSTWDNALTVSVNRRLALQLGGKWAYRNLPALQEIPLFAAAPAPGASSNLKALAPYRKSDFWLTVSLVVNWGPSGPSGAKPTP